MAPGNKTPPQPSTIEDLRRKANEYHLAALEKPDGPHAGAFAAASANLLQSASMMELAQKFGPMLSRYLQRVQDLLPGEE